jgi:predicted hotdog family 3-hydroxylacyl-ACP dehydratase
MLNHEEICKLIPHSGAMCLLDTVEDWDEKRIVCTSATHRDINNPLRHKEGLSMLSLIEYGAQAMAVHGCLLAEKNSMVMEEGYLVALRDIQISPGLVSDVENDLEIIVDCLFSAAGNMIYNLSIQVCNTVLVCGRATVMAKYREQEPMT